MLENFCKHTYTFAAEGLKVKEKRFSSRQAANEQMYKIVGKLGLQLTKVYDDKHYKTYIFSNGSRIHINREQKKLLTNRKGQSIIIM